MPEVRASGLHRPDVPRIGITIMTKQLFRKESLERVSSPDQLDDYIRVSNPGVWMVLVTIVLLLVAGIVWACVGQLTDTLTTTLAVRDGQAACYVPEDQIDQVKPGTPVAAGDSSGTVAQVGPTPLSPDEVAASVDEYTAHRINATGWSYPVEVDIDLPDGIYDARITARSFSPIELLLGSGS